MDPLDALRARGAARFDPAGLRLIEALARRRVLCQGATASAIEQRLQVALAAFGQRFERAEARARDALGVSGAHYPRAAEMLRGHYEAGDFAAVHRLLARLQARGQDGALAGLVGAPPSAPVTDGAAPAAVLPSGELRAVRRFRSTWSRLKVQRQVSQALSRAPQNAGPLNSEFLVLQALTRMRDIAPAYLEQFVPYVDALLWLEQPAPPAAPPARASGRRRRKPGAAP